MVYAHHLREEGNRFMRTTLGYDPSDGDGREEAEGGGGDYISVHLRRRDFLYSRLGEGGRWRKDKVLGGGCREIHRLFSAT